MATKFWCKELLMIKPDPAPYLLAARRPREVRLLSSAGSPLYWTSQPQLVENTLNNTSTQGAPFIFSFKLHSSVLCEGTNYIFDYPGLLAAKSENGMLAFKFYWMSNVWMYITGVTLQQGFNDISLICDGVKLYMTIGSATYTFVDMSQPTPTKVLSYTNNGCIIDGYNAQGRSGAYLEATTTPSLVGADSWEFGTRYRYIKGQSGYAVIFGPKESYYRGLPELAIQESNDQLYVNVAYSSSVANSIYVEVYLNSTTDYVFKVYKKSGEPGVYLSVSTDGGDTETEYKVSSSDQYAMDGVVMTYLNGRISDNRYTPGIIDTSRTYMIVDGTYYSYKEELMYGAVLPHLNIGELSLNKDWTKIKDIRAVLL